MTVEYYDDIQEHTVRPLSTTYQNYQAFDIDNDLSFSSPDSSTSQFSSGLGQQGLESFGFPDEADHFEAHTEDLSIDFVATEFGDLVTDTTPLPSYIH